MNTNTATAAAFHASTRLIGGARSEKRIPTPDGSGYRTARSTRGVYEPGALPYEAISRRLKPGASKSRTRGWDGPLHICHPQDDWDVAHVYSPQFLSRFPAREDSCAPIFLGGTVPASLRGRPLNKQQPYSLLPNHYLVVPRRWNLGMARPSGIPAAEWYDLGPEHFLSLRWFLTNTGASRCRIARVTRAASRLLNSAVRTQGAHILNDKAFGVILEEVYSSVLR